MMRAMRSVSSSRNLRRPAQTPDIRQCLDSTQERPVRFAPGDADVTASSDSTEPRPAVLRNRLISIRPKKIARIEVVIPDAIGDLAALSCGVHLACELSCIRRHQTVSTKTASCSFLVLLETHP